MRRVLLSLIVVGGLLAAVRAVAQAPSAEHFKYASVGIEQEEGLPYDSIGNSDFTPLWPWNSATAGRSTGTASTRRCARFTHGLGDPDRRGRHRSPPGAKGGSSTPPCPAMQTSGTQYGSDLEPEAKMGLLEFLKTQ
ncbi:MAG TPA: hypothetical protein PLH72_11640 [Vicinamibacterales bacterium]|nr:hypothetical protein [Vicinamibacterales bacterium]